MAVGMGMTMAPATESVMGSLPTGEGRRRIGRQRHHPAGRRRPRRRRHRQRRVERLRQQRRQPRSPASASPAASSTEAAGSLGGALEVGSALGPERPAFVDGVKEGFVDALSIGLRLSSLIILGAAFVAWRFLPARAGDPLAVDVEPAAAAAPSPPVGG